MNVRKACLCFLIVLLMVVAAACSGGQEPASTNTDNTNANASTDNEQSESSEEETVQLRFAYWAGGDRAVLYDTIIKNFEKKYPHIKVQSEIADFGPYWDKMATQTAAGNPPDIFQQHLTKVAEYADRGQLRPLDDFVEQGTINLSDFGEKVVDSGRYNGEIVMVTMGNSITGALYNEDIFAEAGVEPPGWSWTWEDYENKAIELANAIDRDDFWGFEDSGGDERILGEFVGQRGRTLYTEDGQLGFTKQDLIDYLSMFDRMRQAGAAPSGEASEQYSVDAKERHGFPLGHYALTLKASNHLGPYQGYSDDTLSITRVPHHGGDEGELTFSGAYLSISPYTEHAEEAALLIDYWVNDPEAGKLFELEQGVPGSSKIVDLLLSQLNETDQKIATYVNEAFAYANDPIQYPPGSSEVVTLLEQANDYVAFGQKTVEQAVDDFFREAGRILE